MVGALPGPCGTVACALDHMGTMYVERGKFAKAEPLERKALAIRQDESDPTAIGTSYMHLAMLLYGGRDLAGAEADAEMATLARALSSREPPIAPMAASALRETARRAASALAR